MDMLELAPVPMAPVVVDTPVTGADPEGELTLALMDALKLAPALMEPTEDVALTLAKMEPVPIRLEPEAVNVAFELVTGEVVLTLAAGTEPVPSEPEPETVRVAFEFANVIGAECV